jgi:hypothetical protein
VKRYSSFLEVLVFTLDALVFFSGGSAVIYAVPLLIR